MCCRRFIGCSLLQCVQHVAVVYYFTGCLSVLLCVVGAPQVVLCSSVRGMVQRAAECCRVLQSAAICCSVLQALRRSFFTEVHYISSKEQVQVL